MEQPTDICPNCEGTRWEHSEEQWIYCHLPADYRAKLKDDNNSLVIENEDVAAS